METRRGRHGGDVPRALDIRPERGCRPASLKQPAAGAPALRLDAGDLLEITTFDTPELSGKFRVDSRGHVTLPVGGSVPVQGLTAEQAGNAIERLLRDRDILKNPHVTVLVLEYATQGVSVLGEVKQPGIYPMQGKHGVLDFISMAGGLTATASKVVNITHRAPPWDSVTVNLAGAHGGSLENDMEVQPGDRVVALRAGVVYVIGDVGKPGGYVMDGKWRGDRGAGPGAGAGHEPHGKVERNADSECGGRKDRDATGAEQDSGEQGTGPEIAGWRHRVCAAQRGQGLDEQGSVRRNADGGGHGDLWALLRPIGSQPVPSFGRQRDGGMRHSHSFHACLSGRTQYAGEVCGWCCWGRTGRESRRSIAGIGDGVAAGFAGCDSYHLRPLTLRGRREAEVNRDPHGQAARGTLVTVLKLAYLLCLNWLGYLASGSAAGGAREIGGV